MHAMQIEDITDTETVTEAPKDNRPKAAFIVLRTDIEKVLEVASGLEVEVLIEDLEWKKVLNNWDESMTEHPDYDAGLLELLGEQMTEDGKRERAESAAALYARVTLRAPAIEERLIGVATVEGTKDGEPLIRFAAVPGEKGWSPERVSGMDMRQCDICGVKHHRKKMFLVQHLESNEIRQIGGACAANRDLARRLSLYLKALKQFEREMSKMDTEFHGFFGGRGYSYNPKVVFMLSDMMIKLHGYVSGKKAWDNNRVISTKSRVLDAMSVLYGWNRPLTILGRSQARQERQDLSDQIHSYAREDVGELYNEAVAFVEAKYAEKQTDFTTNLRTALYTGSTKMIGFLVWVPAGLTKAKSVKAVQRSGPWTPVVPQTGDELAAYLGKWGKAQVMGDLGLDAKKIERELKKAVLTKGMVSKLGRHVPGVWAVGFINEFSSDFGTTYFVKLVRVEDGAEVLWKNSWPALESGGRAVRGDQIRIMGASIGEIPPEVRKNGKVYQDGRKINRVKAVKA